MQGFSDPQRELLDAESVTGHLLPTGSVFGFLAQHRLALFPAEMFTDLFRSGRGRPSVAPDVVASVLVLQALHGLSDRQAADAVTFDLRWKAACGLAVTDTSFHATTLTYWRRRLAASKSPDRIFDTVRTVIKQTGVIRGKTRRVLDSTVLDDAVATQDTVTQLVPAPRRSWWDGRPRVTTPGRVNPISRGKTRPRRQATGRAVDTRTIAADGSFGSAHMRTELSVVSATCASEIHRCSSS